MPASPRIALIVPALLASLLAPITAVAQEAVPSLNVLCFGDSITAGVGASSNVFGATTYPSRLLALLQARPTSQPVTVINVGKPGEYAFDAAYPPPVGSDRFVQMVDGFKPHLVLLLEGVNDIAAGQSSSQIAMSLGRMVRAAKARSFSIFAATLTPVVPGNPKGFDPATIAAANVAIRSMAASEQVRLVDLEAAFGTDWSLFTPDGLHPNDAGYEVMARAFFNAIAANAPTLRSISPASGPTTGGTTVTATGGNFVAGATVAFGAAAATSVTVTSATSLTAVSPPGTGLVAVSVTTRFGTVTLGDAFTYRTPLPPPTVASLWPTSGPVTGGTVVTVTGTGFVTGETSVTFGTNGAVSVAVASETSLTAVSPPGTGTVTVKVSTPWGSASLANAYTYGPPVITRLAPDRVRAGAGPFTLVVTGSNFLAGAQALWNGAPRPTVVASPGELWVAVGSRDVWAPAVVQLTVQNAAPSQGMATAPFEVFGPWTIAGTGDMNHDGMDDLLWQSANGYVAAWIMNGTSQVSNTLLYQVPVAVGGWRTAAVGDLDGDGHADLIWQHADGWVAAWIMNGTSQVTSALLCQVPVAVGGWRIVAAGDMNGDGKADLIWQSDAGYVAVWLMDGLSQIGNQLLYPSPVALGGWNIVGAGDFNGDGRTDVLWQSDEGYAAVWLMDGTSQASNLLLYPTPVATGGWWIAGAGDLNGDGRTDVVFQHMDGWVAAWIMDGTSQVSNSLLTPARVW